MKIVMLLSFIPNPRMMRRINLLKQKYELVLIYWNRKAINEAFNQNIKSYEIKLQADFHTRNPIKRIINTLKFQRKALKLIRKEKPQIIYLQNLDMLEIASRYKKGKIIYEIADLNTLIIDKQKSIILKIISFILKWREKKLIKKVSLLVITSMKYYEEYYYQLISEEKVIYIPNIPDIKYFKNYQKKRTGPYTVAYIGAIRYERQIMMLIDAAKIAGVKVLIAGFSYNNIISEYAQGHNHVLYFGSYDYQKEVARLYSMADCIYSVYDTDKKNVTLALPNRLFEAIYCNLPIIASKGTYLGEVVEKLQIGFTVAASKIDELIDVLLKLQNKDLNQLFAENALKNKHLLNVDDYQNKLLEAMEIRC